MPSSTNINNSFFQGSYKQAWKKIIPHGLTEAEVDFIQEIAGLKNSDRVLDIMCGYGRHALELAQRGLFVTAIDNLEEYIDEIKTTTKKEGFAIEAIQTDVLHAQLKDQYEAAICMGNSFAFFDRTDAINILKNIAAHLKSGGIFIINSWTIAEIAIKHFKERDWHNAGDFKCVLENTYHFHPSRIESEQTILAASGAVEVIKGVDYIYTLSEMETMFNEAGLKTKNLFSTPRKRKFKVGDGQIYIVAEKI